MKQAQYKRRNEEVEPSRVSVKMRINCIYSGITITFKGDEGSHIVSPIRDPAMHLFANDTSYDLDRGLPTLH